MIKNTYMDNSATSFPKAPGVADAVMEYITKVGANVNRSSHQHARNASFRVFETRELAKQFFHFSGEEANVIFTSGATYALNQVIKGYLKPGDHVLISSLEHNAVMRPLRELEKTGLKISLIPTDERGIANIEQTKEIINQGIDMLIISHASNVCGNIFPLKELASLIKEKNIPFVLDASQSAGHVDINFDQLGLSALCAPAHKGLLAPQGLGLMILSTAFASQVKPLVSGGTGSFSDSEIQPEILPDKFESGTPNIPAIFGLHASLEYLLNTGIDTIRAREMKLTTKFLHLLEEIKPKHGFRLLGNKNIHQRLGVISLDFQQLDNAEVTERLESEYGIMTRCGLHCAPTAHKTLGTYPQGAVRFSLSHFTTEEEIDHTVQAIKEILHG